MFRLFSSITILILCLNVACQHPQNMGMMPDHKPPLAEASPTTEPPLAQASDKAAGHDPQQTDSAPHPSNTATANKNQAPAAQALTGSPPEICNGRFSNPAGHLWCFDALDHGDVNALVTYGAPISIQLASGTTSEQLQPLAAAAPMIVGLDLSMLDDVRKQDLVSLAKLTRLKNIDLSGADGITPNTLHGLAGLTTLETLNLSSLNINASTVAMIASLPALQEVDLSQTSLLDEDVLVLAQSTTLKRIVLAHTNVSQAGIAALTTVKPELKIVWAPPQLLDRSKGVELWSNGELRYQNKSFRPDSSGHADFVSDDSELRVARFDSKHLAIHLLINDLAGEEDPPPRQVVYLLETRTKKLIKAFEGHLGTHKSNELKFNANGQMSYLTDPWAAHEKYGGKEHKIIFKLEPSSGRLKFWKSKETGRAMDEPTG